MIDFDSGGLQRYFNERKIKIKSCKNCISNETCSFKGQLIPVNMVFTLLWDNKVFGVKTI